MKRLFLAGCALLTLFSCEKPLTEEEENSEETQATLIVNPIA